MKKNQIIFFTILTIITFFLIWLIYLADQRLGSRQEINIFTNLSSNLNNQPLLINNYQRNLQKIFEDFLANQNLLSTDQSTRIQLFQQLENDILTLIVPAEYKELHLKIVIAINKLMSQDPLMLEQSRQLLNEQIKLNQWLAPVLTLFIINFY